MDGKMSHEIARGNYIVIVISSMLFYRNYISSGIVSEIIRSFSNVKILAHVSLRTQEFPQDPVFFDYNNQQYQDHVRFLKILTWRYRHKSKTFWFRLRRTAQFHRFGEISQEVPFGSRVRQFWTQNVNSLLRWFKIITLGNRIVFPLTKLYFTVTLRPSKSFTETVLGLEPALILFASSAYDPVAIDLTNIGKKANVKTFNLIDNWDNLSSKSILWVLSDFVGVWGQQAKEHALEIQGFNAKSVKIIGTPRFDHYFYEREKIINSNFSFPYILFVGTSLFTDEIGVLTHLNTWLENTKGINNNTKIVYRPHPWGMQKNLEDLKDLNRVVIDPQVLESISRPLGDLDFQPGLEYYPSLISNSLFVVGGLTSMAIEASIFFKNFIAICHKEDGNFTDPYSIKVNYAHFDNLDILDNIWFSYDFHDLDFILTSLSDRQSSSVDRASIDQNRQYFLYHGRGSYADRLIFELYDIFSHFN